ARPGYADRLFDPSVVHTIDIEIAPEVWQGMLDNAAAEEYVACDVVVDGERFANVGLRPKGSNSLTQVAKYGLDRYSLKIEFDHYQSGFTYYGLDKLSLATSFQDNSFMKEVIAYDMMAQMGVPAPLCSYAFVTVNGQDWGLFIAIEEIEEAFMQRNYGRTFGQLYKPGYRRLDDANDDIALIYTDDAFESYDNIFRNAKFDIRDSDKARLIEALRILGEGEELEQAVDIDHMLRYFVVQSFVVNLDSYLGHTGHNYYLVEENGILSMLPWDYNLAFGTYALGGPRKAEDDATRFVNWPIDTPESGEVMRRRPMYHNLMLQEENFRQYYSYYGQFIAEYFTRGHFEALVDRTAALIAPYVQRDPTKFCSYEDFELAVYTLETFCLLRAESVQGQLNGSIPSTLKGQNENRGAFIDASMIQIADLGDFEDMEHVAEVW
ncbi:CotH kinase family protein, partial [Ruminococcaceae bacterium OttesenSCG-928-O06]|nr:CotH kinase family protein [Ruminococcaceae bacterium OttesenSCG-928-O06]